MTTRKDMKRLYPHPGREAGKAMKAGGAKFSKRPQRYDAIENNPKARESLGEVYKGAGMSLTPIRNKKRSRVC